ncbi:metal ABC transporter solute-binding protein, Zn/Mn family [Lacticaseibacillus sharpeae]|uniref:Abc superfamily atp binding cassette transporter, binding protein n=1 Tax=Lacticaseibacillus sharpeae JCM 1186 = DSM 20505 TaxID=1291052 RepID=A0A0R1ZVS9_9LACO|nr:zinc ABC transporter substrate-binding protein [Lacticaseibacillus sharpeae]KRM55897.1 abc superfamily atp binding cassette transporter, binding protein [Lacticaseibacillus sharpeae JCM 1186 = DSM 20505]
MKKKTWIGLAAGLVLVGLAIGCGWHQQQSRKQARPQIVASLDFYGEITQAVAGNDADVTTIIHSTRIDPHDYEPTASVARKFSEADLVVNNGAGYDTWSTRFAHQVKVPMITVAKLLNYRTGANEHLWFRPDMARKLTDALVHKLSALDSKHRHAYERRGQEYLQKLQSLTSLQHLARTKLRGVHYLTTEPVYDNTLTRLGAQSQLPDFANAVEEETDPRASDIKTWHKLIRKRQVAFVINNPQNSSKTVEQAIADAKKYHVPVINVTETKPAHTTYIAWQKALLREVMRTLN